jgi:hypothetical protein
VDQTPKNTNLAVPFVIDSVSWVALSTPEIVLLFAVRNRFPFDSWFAETGDQSESSGVAADASFMSIVGNTSLDGRDAASVNEVVIYMIIEIL